MKNLGYIATLATALASFPGCSEAKKDPIVEQKKDPVVERIEAETARLQGAARELQREIDAREQVKKQAFSDAQQLLDQPKVADGYPGRIHAFVSAREASQRGESEKAIGRYTHAIVMILEDMATIEEKEHPSVKEQEELERLRKQFDIVVAERKQQFEKLSAEQKGAAVREADSESRVTNLREPWSDPLVLEYEQQHGNRVRKSRRPFEESLPHPFEKAIESLREQGEIKGYPDGEFRPEPQVNPVK